MKRGCGVFLRPARTEHHKTFSRFIFKNNLINTFKRGVTLYNFWIDGHPSILESNVDSSLPKRPSAALRKTLLAVTTERPKIFF